MSARAGWIPIVTLLFACGETPEQSLADAGSGRDDVTNAADGAIDGPDGAIDGGHDAGAELDAGRDCSQVSEPCSIDDASRCTPGGVSRCIEIDGCFTWSPPTACEVDEQCVVGACRSCAGRAGTFHEQTIQSDGQERYYYLHVPSSYDCQAGMPLLLDFHGTAGDLAEEAYGLAESRAIADREGFIILRPRSNWAEEGGQQVYRWDQNAGDLMRNVTFARRLVEQIESDYHVRSGHRYVAGYSSGTNMSAQFLAFEGMFRGYGLVGGGFWNPPSLSNLANTPARIYAVTGYRDYLVGTLHRLLQGVTARGNDPDLVFYRETDAGHDLVGWHYEEMWAWLSRLERPQDAPLRAGWTEDTGVPTEQSLVELTTTAAGEVLVAGAQGSIFLRTADDTPWTRTGRVMFQSSPVSLTGICMLPSGVGMATGQGTVSYTTDHGRSWAVGPAITDFAGQGFGYAYLLSVACFGTSSIIGGGYWTGVRSDDGGLNWVESPMVYTGFDAAAQVADIEVNAQGTMIAVGGWYAGRSTGELQFTEFSLPASVHWHNAVSAGPASPSGRWWIAADQGTIFHSSDDGLSWTVQATPTDEDLYAIDFFDENLGMAVGVHGAAIVTDDGGATWRDVSIGLDRFLGDVVWLDADRALVVGERGTALVYRP